MRKYKKGITGKDKWWFLLKGQESVLKELETGWENVSLQTRWKLEACTKPTDGNATTQSNTVNSQRIASITSPSTTNDTQITNETQTATCDGTVDEPDNHGMTQDSQKPETINGNFLSEVLVSPTLNN